MRKPQCEVCNLPINIDPNSSIKHQRVQNKGIHNRKHRKQASIPIYLWYHFPQMEGPEILSVEDDQNQGKNKILFICPIYPCNGQGCCNHSKVIQREEIENNNDFNYQLQSHEQFIKAEAKKRVFYSFGYHRKQCSDKLEDVESLGIDYISKRYVPLFDGYKSMLMHIISNHTEDQLKSWGYSRSFMKSLLKSHYSLVIQD